MIDQKVIKEMTERLIKNGCTEQDLHLSAFEIECEKEYRNRTDTQVPRAQVAQAIRRQYEKLLQSSSGDT